MKFLKSLWLLLLVPVYFVARAFGFHWCQDETNMLLMTLPFGAGIVGWLKAKHHHHKHHRDCEQSPSISEDSEV